MQKRVDGIHRFQPGSFRSEDKPFAGLAAGQNPLALFITCSDSRIDPNLLTQTKPGELFILRTAGNILPPYGSVSGGGEAATIEYAVSTLKISDIVVYGHSHCGAMSGLLVPASLHTIPAVTACLEHAQATRQSVELKYPEQSPPKRRFTQTVEEHVLAQIQNLKTHPCVAAAVDSGKLKLHGWGYTFETGEVSAFDPNKAQFTRLDDTEVPEI